MSDQGFDREIKVETGGGIVKPSALALIGLFRLGAYLVAFVLCQRWCVTWSTWIGAAALFSVGMPYIEGAIGSRVVRLIGLVRDPKKDE